MRNPLPGLKEKGILVIEKVTQEDYFDHIRKVIYKPAGMTNGDCYEMDYPVENLAIGYSPDCKSPYGWQNNYYMHVIKGGPAGGALRKNNPLRIDATRRPESESLS